MRLGILIVIVLCAIITSRLFFLQIVKSVFYKNLASRQQGFSRILEPKRGDIYFQDKNGKPLKAAATKAGGLLYLNVKALENPEKVFEKINEITQISKKLYDEIIKKKNDPYEILKRRITLEEAERIVGLDLPGVGVSEERWRFYPSASLASHILGFVSSSNESPEGQYGVEQFFNEELRGREGKISGDLDGRGILIALSKELKTDPQEGAEIILTIEPVLQRAVEYELTKTVKKWRARSGGIIIIEPKTGKIRALAAAPTYDPNEFQKEKNFSVFLNPFVEKIFELGSVFKPLTMAAAIDAGAITSSTTYIDKGEVGVGDRIIKNFDNKARGLRTMTQVLEESLNTGAVFAMQRLGGEKLKKYFKSWGLGEKLGIELPGELKGDLSNLESGREVEYATASFGQGLAVTPLELTYALASLSNGGKLIRPTIVEKNVPPQIIRQVVKPETATEVTKMLVEVVDKALAGGQAKMEHMSIAAKTGTAQIPAAESGGGKGYSNEFMHSFFGYFPAYDAKFLIFMFLERPEGVKYASGSMTDTFKALVEFLINYYTIPSDR